MTNAVAFSSNGKAILTGSKDGTARLWDLPSPLGGDPNRILRWTQIVTDMELDKWGSIRFLDDQTWRRYRQELQLLGGPPPR